MNLKKFLKIVGIILLVAIIIILIHTFRNYMIIRKLQNNIKPYEESNNFYIQTKTQEGNGTEVTLDYYKKNEKEVAIMERKVNDEVSKMSMYNNGERIDIFFDTPTEKAVQIGANVSMIVNSNGYLETDNNWQTFLGSIFAIIKSKECEGKDCYFIKNFMSPMFLMGTEKNEFYFEKDTGLYIKTVIDNQIAIRNYEYNNVNDEIFIEPDLSQYTIKDSNE